ncbi:unnamed protein product [Pleuronectes platessa]|uniref:Uncharacterized protein n=1 Tax=Pleuronectes platessa TaxID=8262 RepID=A0A9N7ZC86_PLEPL|nr:unnamed protein product [Pleuronectes platessa]
MATTSLSEPCPLSDTSLSLPHHKQSRITIVVLEQSATLHKEQEKGRGFTTREGPLGPVDCPSKHSCKYSPYLHHAFGFFISWRCILPHLTPRASIIQSNSPQISSVGIHPTDALAAP